MIVIALMLLMPHGAGAASCASMSKELLALRQEYHSYADRSDKGKATFEELTKILDQIVELKNAMRKAACPSIPERSSSKAK